MATQAIVGEREFVGSVPESGSPQVNLRILKGMTPREVPRTPGFSVAAASMTTGAGAGSTMWGAVLLGQDVAFHAMDVDDGGVLPAYHLAVCRALIRSASRRLEHEGEEAHPGRLLSEVNRDMDAARIRGLDHSTACAVLQLRDGGARWAAAGEVGGAVLRRDGSFEELTSQGPSLGMLDGFEYGCRSMELNAGDHVLILTGATNGLLRGAGDLVANRKERTVEEVVETLHRALERATRGVGHDATVLLVRAS